MINTIIVQIGFRKEEKGMELSGFLVWHYYDKNGKLIR